MKSMAKEFALFSRQKLLANLAMLLVVVFWGVSFISIKIAVSEIPPVTMALIRFAIASGLLLLLLNKIEPEAKIDARDIPRLVLGGILGITLYFYCENIGVKLSTAVNASLIVSTVPIIAISLDVLFFHGRVSGLKILGIGLAVIGTYLAVTANGKLELNSGNFLGNMLMVGAMLSWSFYTLINKSLQEKYTGVFLTTWQTVFGTLCLIPLSLVEYKEWGWFSVRWGGTYYIYMVCGGWMWRLPPFI